jgi:multimeric flavodoxin WrbA
MKLLAVNGSPRKNKNTAMLLEQVVAGAAAKGAEAELVHLRGRQYSGCVSCFECKRIGGPSYGTARRPRFAQPEKIPPCS